MKKIFIMAALSAALVACTNSNPFLSEYNTPFDTPRFEDIKLEHYKPAFEKGVEQARENIDKITSNTAEATFENTIVALENSQELLGKVASVFYNLHSCLTSDEMDVIAEQIQPMMSELSNDISLNPELFARIKYVYENAPRESLTTEQITLLDDTYKGFARGGANLSDEHKQKRRELTKELGLLNLSFSKNVLAETNAFSIDIPTADSALVEELPSFVKDILAGEAKEKGFEGWTITLQHHCFGPFMNYSSNRELKKTLWEKYNSRANQDNENSNQENIKRIAEIRLELAKLLGYATYADYVIENRMAESSANVFSFLDELLTATKELALQDFNTIKDYATEQGFEGEFSPWDFGYWSEKYKTAKYALNDDLIKPYLQLDTVKQAVFMLAERMYGLKFIANKEIQVYHPEVEVYEVYDANDRFMAILYMDFFPRESKSAGAWMTSFRDLETKGDGTQVRPLISICTNFTKPTENSPSLLTFNELTTLLHEFGHALHGILAEGTYASTTGTSVYHDFVELPSQIMENWASEKEYLDLWAKHYQTGEKMPEDLIEKIIKSKNYLAGYANIRQLNFALTDLAWHSITEPIEVSVEEFEAAATSRTSLFFPSYEGMSFSTSFSHIFAGGYAAGYYGYKWSEVLAADAFSVFKQRGVMNSEVASEFRDKLLSKGGTDHPMKLYVDFTGHKPSVDALLKSIKGEE